MCGLKTVQRLLKRGLQYKNQLAEARILSAFFKEGAECLYGLKHVPKGSLYMPHGRP